MMKYIGDISQADAKVLADLASASENILEFGCGASTQVIKKYSGLASFASIDTSPEWIEITKKNLDLLDVKGAVAFFEYHEFMKTIPHPPINFDFVFVDGVDALRREFALKIWRNLAIGGVMAFHDTRRAPDFRNFVEVLVAHFTEVNEVQVNYLGSNISFMRRKIDEPYDNWQITEKKEPWMLGYGAPPIDKKGNILWPKT